jgi:hypothetical protein
MAILMALLASIRFQSRLLDDAPETFDAFDRDLGWFSTVVQFPLSFDVASML